MASHEILHSLGFLSSVDTVASAEATQNQTTAVTIYPGPLDLFRLKPDSQRSTSFATSPRLLTTGSIYPYPVTYDGDVFNPAGETFGVTLSAGDVPMSTGSGVYFGTSTQIGDGRQASHWKDDSLTTKNIGLMDPNIGTGVAADTRTVDQRVLGLIGWDVSDLGRAIADENGNLSVRGTTANNAITMTRSTDASGTVFIAQIDGVKATFGNSAIGSVTVEAGDGIDNVTGSTRPETIGGGAGVDTLNGGSGDDLIDGNDGNDVILGGAGADSLQGGANDDAINGGDDGDSLRGDAGVDSLFGEAGNDTLDSKDDTIDQTLKGGTGTDLLYYDLSPNEISKVNADIETATGVN